MAQLEVCERKQRTQPLQRPVPWNLLASRDKPQQGRTRQEGAEMGRGCRDGWAESQEEALWPSLAPAGIPRLNATRKCGFFFFLLRHMSCGCPQLNSCGTEQGRKLLQIHRLATS